MRYPKVINFEVPRPSPPLFEDLYFTKLIQNYLKNSHGKFHSKILIGLKVLEIFQKKSGRF